MLVFRGVYYIYLHVVDVYGKLVAKHTVRPMDPIGKGPMDPIGKGVCQHDPT